MVSALGVRQILMFGVKHGLDPEELCAAAGISAAVLSDGRFHVPYAWFLAIFGALIDRLPNLGVALQLGLFASVEQFGYLGQAAKHSSSPLDALTLLVQFAPFVDTLMKELPPTLELGPETITWALPALRHDPPEWVEAVFVGTLACMQALSGRRITPLEVRFTHAREPLKEIYEGFFCAPVRFRAAIDAIDFDRDALEQPLRNADAGARRRFQEHFRKLMAAAGDPLATAVERAIESALESGTLSQQRVAKLLGMSSRSLQRKLRERGMRYQKLIEESRRSLASRLLLDRSRNISEVALAIGYDISSFNRIFRRWTGVSPSAYRKARLRTPIT